MTIRNLDIASLFARDAADIAKARSDAVRIHGTGDIRAAGNEVELTIREYLRRMLPPRYYVTTGHLIDQAGNISPQLDIIVADNLSLPSLMTTVDGTEYIPITSALAIGEIKSAYKHSERPYEKFSSVLKGIHREMYRPLLENTAYPSLNPNTSFDHMVFGSANRYLNHLFSFFFCVSAGDFEFEKIDDFLTKTEARFLPSTAVFLDSGIIAYGYLDDVNQRFSFHKYPIEVAGSDHEWCFAKGFPPLEGSHLAFLYGQLISHLSNSHLPSANAYPYLQSVGNISRSSIRWARLHRNQI